MASINLTGTQVQSLMIESNSGTIITQDQSNASATTATAEDIASPQLSEAQVNLQSFWQNQLNEVQALNSNDFKTQDLPLARIKKIMKMDEDVKMISAEAPLLFAKAAQIFITELSLRAWIHTEESKRRTLQRNDIATAITKFDQFDFLIDIVPREELKPARKPTQSSDNNMQYFYSVPQSSATTSITIPANASQSVANLQQNQLILTQPENQQGQPLTVTPVNMDGSQVLQLVQNTQQIAGNTITTNQQEPAQSVSSQNAESQPQQKSDESMLQQITENISDQTSQPNNQEMHTLQLNSRGQLQLFKIQQNSNTDNQHQLQEQQQEMLESLENVGQEKL